MYTIAVLTVCVALVVILGALAFLVSVFVVLLRTGIHAAVTACEPFALKAIHFAYHPSTQHDYHTWHTVTR